jgi:hypothetical protein
VNAANMFDILPPDAMPLAAELPDDLARPARLSPIEIMAACPVRV